MSEETQEKLTPEQIEDNRKKVIQYYKKQAEVLEFQAKYENLLADIETARAKRMEMIIRQAQVAAGQQEEAPEQSNEQDSPAQDEAPVEERKERKLKSK